MSQREQFQLNHLGHITRNENLTSSRAGFEPTCPIGDGSKIVVAAKHGVAPMKSDAHTQGGSGPPVCASQFILNAHSSVNGCLGILERRAEMITGPSEDVATRSVNDAVDQRVVNFHTLGCRDCVCLPKTTGPLHIGKQKSNDPGGDRITIPERLSHSASR